MSKAIDVFNMRIRESCNLIIVAIILAACSQASHPENKDSLRLKTLDESSNFQPPMGPYDLPYRVGSLGGKPVNLGEGIRFVEFNDSPDLNLGSRNQNYKSRSRTYDSLIQSFGLTMRYTDGLLLITYYKAPQSIVEKYKTQRHLPDNQWVEVGVSADQRYQPNLEAALINSTLDSKIQSKESMAETHYVGIHLKSKKNEYDLEKYVPHPKWVKQYGYEKTTDLYIHRNERGKVDTLIHCKNYSVFLERRCDQDFLLEPFMKVRVDATFQRVHLQDWQLIQQQTTKLIKSFVVTNQSNQSNK